MPQRLPSIDAFLDTWKGENNFVTPPIGMIEPVISHILRTKSTAIVVLPKWEQSCWWPIVLRLEQARLELNRENITGNGQAEIWRNMGWKFVVLSLNGERWSY